MKTLQESILYNINESKYVRFDEKDIDKMDKDQLYDAFEQAAAAKAACYVRKDKKGEAELAELIKKIRSKLN